MDRRKVCAAKSASERTIALIARCTKTGVTGQVDC
jgi:hypothetical protein